MLSSAPEMQKTLRVSVALAIGLAAVIGGGAFYAGSFLTGGAERRAALDAQITTSLASQAETIGKLDAKLDKAVELGTANAAKLGAVEVEVGSLKANVEETKSEVKGLRRFGR